MTAGLLAVATQLSLTALDYNTTFSSLTEDYALVSIDRRIVRTNSCATAEATIETVPSLRAAALSCWRDSCICRGGDWVEAEGLCSHKCHGVSCPPRTCKRPGSCASETGECRYEDVDDGEACEPDFIARHEAAELMNSTLDPAPSPAFRCYFGKCLHTRGCGKVQCPLPASECFAVGCNTTHNATAATCVHEPLNGTLCHSGDGVCVEGVCTPLNAHTRPWEHYKRGTRPPNLCHGVTCERMWHPCRENGGCVDGVCTEVQKPNGTECDDGIPDTVEDSCQAGSCVGKLSCLTGSGGRLCSVAEPECTAPACLGGQCFEVEKPDGTPCSDDDPSTTHDFCLAGKCVGASRFYSCGNHEQCYHPLLQCLSSLAPQCTQTYHSHCVVLSAAQNCPLLPFYPEQGYCSAANRLRAATLGALAAAFLLLL